MATEAIRAVLITLLLVPATFGFGVWFLPLFPEQFTSYSKYATAWAAGLGAFALTIFVAGLWRLTRGTIGLLIAIGVVSALVYVWRHRATFAQMWSRLEKPPGIALAVVSAVMLVSAIGGLAEPLGDWGTDGVAYHFTGPKFWLRDGVIRPIPDNAPTSYPCAGEMIFAAAMAFGGERAPGFSAVLTYGICLMLVASLALRCGLGQRGAWWTVAVVAAMGAVHQGAHSGFVDVVYATFALAAARIGFDSETPGNFAAFGALCGMAMAVKYPGLVALPLLILCAAWPREGWPGARSVKHALAALGGAFLTGSPMYLKNWYFLGCPIYPAPPFAAHFLHVKYYSEEGLRAFYHWARYRGRGHGHGIVQLFTLPFNLTYHTADFHGAGGIGPAPLALAPLGVIAGWGNGFARRLAVLGGLLLIAWFATMQESRYLIHVYTIAGIFTVLGWEYCGRLAGKRLRVAATAVIGISLLYGLFLIGAMRWPDVYAVVSAKYAVQRHEAEYPFRESFEYLNHTAEVSRVLILDRSVTPYYLDKEYLKPFSQWGEQSLPEMKDAGEVLGRLGELKISHVMDVRSTILDFQVPRNSPGLQLVLEVPDQRVYRVVESGNR